MATASDVISDTLQMVGVTPLGEPSSAEDQAYALGVLNDMLHGWRSKSVDIGHQTLAATETVNMLDEHMEGLKLMLATNPRMTRRYKRGAEFMPEAKRAWGAIYAAYAAPEPAKLPDGLKRLPNSKPFYDRSE